MKGKIIYWLAIVASLIGAVIGFVITGNGILSADESLTRAMWAGAFFSVPFILSFIALQLLIRFGKTYTVTHESYKWIICFIIAGVLLFGIGVGGQYGFMYSKEEILKPTQSDIVLLLDTSLSMDSEECKNARSLAASEFVDILDSKCQLQTVAFAAKNMGSLEFLTMDEEGKETVKNFAESIDGVGATDFNEILAFALESLMDQGREDSMKFVVLITDAKCELDSDVIDEYIDSDVRVCTIRIGQDSDYEDCEEDLTALAEDTDGFDICIIPDDEDTVDVSDMLKKFKKALGDSSETQVEFSENLIIYSEDEITTLHFIIRTVVLVLCAVIVGWGIFGKFNLLFVICNAALGLVSSLLICAFENVNFWLCVLPICLFIYTAYVFLDVRRENNFDV